MKKSLTTPPTECDEIELLLLRQQVERLSSEENSRLQQHLKICIHCQNYGRQLANLHHAMAIDPTGHLTPDPAIRTVVMNRLRQRKPEKQGILNSLWQWLSKVLEYRIPVYQGLVGVACGLLIFVLVKYFPNSGRSGWERSQHQFHLADTTVYQINVIQNLDLIEDQKIGKSVLEDSLLTRFVVTAR